MARLTPAQLPAVKEAVADAARRYKSYHPLHDALIRVYDKAGNVIETHEHKGDLKEW